ncbi:MAG: adenylyltransferase/cytidyltransferase family protein [Gemmatimonadales bacterium]|nr:adenylyltransferase/cytidyltransferase family protein [Gemmatimonadales bacterium]
MRSLPDAVLWRSNAEGPVVFSNGVFDLLHPGHIAVLEAARSLGGSLVVGVNSDASALALGKGSDRPVIAAAGRARMLAALAAVDCVVTFEEPTPLELIAALQPDVLVKGGDYLPETVIGADLVRARGGRVVIVPLVPDWSTTRLLERIRVPS